MSGVYKRFRGETEVQFMMTALELQAELTSYVHKEKFVPKKYRFMLGNIIINKVDEMVDNLTFANSIYATTEEKLAKRKSYQVKAIANCFQLQNQLIRLEKCINTVTIDSLNKIIDLMCREMILLKNGIKTTNCDLHRKRKKKKKKTNKTGYLL